MSVHFRNSAVLQTTESIAELSRPPLDPIGKIGSRYPTNVYDCDWLSLPILRQKVVYDVY